MPRSSCSRAGPFIAPDRATGEEGSRRRCVWGTAGCGWVLPCVRAQHKAGGEAGRGGRRMAKEAMTHLSPRACLQVGKRGHTTNTVSDRHKRV